MKKSKTLSLLLCYGFEKEFKKFSDEFISMFNNDIYPDKIFYFIDIKLYMDYDFKTGYLWCNYDFWRNFESKFYFNYEQVKYLIKFMMQKYFILNEVKPSTSKITNSILLNKHFEILNYYYKK